MIGAHKTCDHNQLASAKDKGLDKEKGQAYVEMFFLSRRVPSTMVAKVFPGAGSRWLIRMASRWF